MVTFSTLTAFFNYLYQLSMGILLGPEHFGILYSLNTMLVLISVFPQAIIITVAKFTSKLKAEGKLDGVNYLWRFSLQRAFIIGIAAFALLAGLSPLFSWFLNMDTNLYPIIVFSGVLIICPLAVNYGTMQGLQRFLPLGLSQALVGFLKVTIGSILVYLGMGIYGGLASIPISFAVVLLVAFFFLRDFRQCRSEAVPFSGVGSYTIFALLALFSITMLSNVDVVLVKHYLSAAEAGNYSAISVLGKIAYYAPLGVAVAMFPKSSEAFEKGRDYRRLFLKAMFLTLAIAGSVVLVYGLFPQFITQLLFGDKYPLAAPNLFLYGLAMALLAFCLLLMNYFLSLNQTKVAYPLLGAMLLQIVLIVFFHSSIAQVVTIMLISGISAVILVLPFFLKVRGLQGPLLRTGERLSF